MAKRLRLATSALTWNADNTSARRILLIPCDAAKTARESGDFATARTLLDTLKDVEVADSCRAEELVALDGAVPAPDPPPCQEASDALDGEEYAKAAALLDALKEDESAKTCRAELLVRLVEARPDPDPAPCEPATDAIVNGEFSKAEALLTALSEDESAAGCRGDALVALEEAKRVEWSTRIRDALTSDWLNTIALLLIAFAIGLVLGGSRVAGRLRRWHITAQLGWLLAFLLALLAVGTIAYRTDPVCSCPYRLRLWLLVALVGIAVLAGAVKALRDSQRSPVTIETAGDQKGFAAEVVAEIGALGTGPTAGVRFAEGTDLAESNVTAALGKVSNPVLTAVLAVMSVVRTNGRARATVAISGDAKAGQDATVSMYDRGRLIQAVTIPGSDFWRRPNKPDEKEIESNPHDLATAVASEVLLWRLGVAANTADQQSVARLYGATVARSVALCAVASRRVRLGHDGALVLFRRAVDRDPGNRAAQVGHISAELAEYPNGLVRDHLVRGLRALTADSKDAGQPIRLRSLYNLWAAEANRYAADKNNTYWTNAVRALWELDGQLRGDVGAPCPTCGAELGATEHRHRHSHGGEGADAGFRRSLHELVRSSWAVVDAKENEREKLLKEPTAAPRGVQLNAACGWGLIALEFPPEDDTVAEMAAARLRLWGAPATEKAMEELLRDPFLAPLAGTSAFTRLKADWTRQFPEPTPPPVPSETELLRREILRLSRRTARWR